MAPIILYFLLEAHPPKSMPYTDMAKIVTTKRTVNLAWKFISSEGWVTTSITLNLRVKQGAKLQKIGLA